MTAIADYLLQRRPHATDGELLSMSSPTQAFADGYAGQALVAAAIGFTFNFNDSDYTSVSLSAHGNAKLAGTHCGTGVDDNNLERVCDVEVLAPWWDTLTTASAAESGGVTYETLGTAPSRYFVAQWRCWPWGHNSSHHQLMTFQLVLRETTNTVEFRYASGGTDYAKTGSPSFATMSASVGARTDTTGTVNGNFREFTEVSGTVDALGGVSTTPSVFNSCKPNAGAHWPGEPTNVLEGASFNFHFIASFAVSGAIATTKTAVAVSFTVDPTSTSVDDASEWAIAAVTGGAADVVVTGASVTGSTVTLTTAPAMTAGATYTVTALSATHATLGAATTASASFIVPSSFVLSPSTEWSHDVLRTLSHAWGQESQKVAGRLATRTTADLSSTATSVWVESTLRMPSSGAAHIRGIRFTYTNKTDTQLTGLATDAPRLRTMPAGSVVVIDPTGTAPASATDDNISQADAAMRATTLEWSSGDDFRRLSILYGVPIPDNWNEESWRAGLRSAAYDRRGEQVSLYQFLRGIWQHLDTDVSVTLDPANPQRITAVSGTPFDQSHVHRWVVIGSAQYWVVGPADVAGAGGSYLELSRVNTSITSGADWSSLASAETATAKLLPFMFVAPTPGPSVPAAPGKACTVIITLFEDDATTTPPTYIQPRTNWLMFDAQSAAFNVDATLTGATSGATAKIRRIVDNGADGALQLGSITLGPGGDSFLDNETITDSGSTPGSATSNGTTGEWYVLFDGQTTSYTVGETITVTGGSEAVGVIRGMVDDGTSGELVVERTSGAAPLDNEALVGSLGGDGDAAGDASTGERPSGQPKGGHVQEDEFEVGDQTSGPYPLYLTGSATAPAVKAVLARMLAAGCHAEINRSLV